MLDLMPPATATTASDSQQAGPTVSLPLLWACAAAVVHPPPAATAATAAVVLDMLLLEGSSTPPHAQGMPHTPAGTPCWLQLHLLTQLLT